MLGLGNETEEETETGQPKRVLLWSQFGDGCPMRNEVTQCLTNFLIDVRVCVSHQELNGKTFRYKPGWEIPCDGVVSFDFFSPIEVHNSDSLDPT